MLLEEDAKIVKIKVRRKKLNSYSLLKEAIKSLGTQTDRNLIAEIVYACGWLYVSHRMMNGYYAPFS